MYVYAAEKFHAIMEAVELVDGVEAMQSVMGGTQQKAATIA